MRIAERSEAEFSWSERRAREEGRVAVPGLDAVLKRLGVTQVDLAWQIGKNERTVRGYRRGRNRPDPITRVAIAEVLGVSVAELEGRGEVPNVDQKAS